MGGDNHLSLVIWKSSPCCIITHQFHLYRSHNDLANDRRQRNFASTNYSCFSSESTATTAANTSQRNAPLEGAGNTPAPAHINQNQNEGSAGNTGTAPGKCTASLLFIAVVSLQIFFRPREQGGVMDSRTYHCRHRSGGPLTRNLPTPSFTLSQHILPCSPGTGLVQGGCSRVNVQQLSCLLPLLSSEIFSFS